MSEFFNLSFDDDINLTPWANTKGELPVWEAPSGWHRHAGISTTQGLHWRKRVRFAWNMLRRGVISVHWVIDTRPADAATTVYLEPPQITINDEPLS